MQIEKAYLFARQISAGATPPPLAEDVFFENGIFNPLYLPQGFDFTNNIYSMSTRGSIYPEDLTYPSDKLGTATTFRIIGDSSSAVQGEDWTIENGHITFRHTVSPGAAKPEYVTRALLIPIVNITDFIGNHRYYNVRCTCAAQEGIENMMDIQVTAYYVTSSTGLSDSGLGGYRDEDLPFEGDEVSGYTSQMQHPADYLSINICAYGGGDPLDSFVFQVDKIYTSDT